MGQPVVHFEIIGADPGRLRRYYSDLFGWVTDDAPVAPEISDAGKYGFVNLMQTPDGVGIPGGIGGGLGHAPNVLFYVGVTDVEQALHDAERLGGIRLMGPTANPNGKITVGHFADLEGNLIGVAGPG